MTATNPTPDDLRTIADNLQSEGHTSRAEVLRNAAKAMDNFDSELEKQLDDYNCAIMHMMNTELDKFGIPTDGKTVTIESGTYTSKYTASGRMTLALNELRQLRTDLAAAVDALREANVLVQDFLDDNRMLDKRPYKALEWFKSYGIYFGKLATKLDTVLNHLNKRDNHETSF